MITNQRLYQPNGYGDDMVLEFAKLDEYLDVMKNTLSFKYELHQAESEESFYGLGIE